MPTVTLKRRSLERTVRELSEPMSDDPTGPNLENLRSFRGMLPSLTSGMSKKDIGGKGIRVLPPTRPRKCCTICALLFDYASAPSDTSLVSEVCEKCQASLDDGYVACVADTRYAFIKSEKLADLAGKILRVNKPTMDELEKQNKSHHRNDPESD